MGVMLLGPAACGKSTVVRVLAGALTRLDAAREISPTAIIHIFPKVW